MHRVKRVVWLWPLVAFIIVGCARASGTSHQPGSTEPPDLVIAVVANGKPAEERLLEAFGEKNGIRVEYRLMPGQDQLATAVRDGAVDLVIAPDYMVFNQFTGLELDLVDDQKLETFQQPPPALYRDLWLAVTPTGTARWVPFSFTVPVLVVNSGAGAKVGTTPDGVWSWQQFESVTNQMATDWPWVLAVDNPVSFVSELGATMSPSGLKSEAYIASLALYENLLQRGLVYRGTASNGLQAGATRQGFGRDLFVEEKVPVLFGMLDTVAEVSSRADFVFSVKPMPGDGPGTYPIARARLAAIPVASKHRDTAQRFLRFLTSNDATCTYLTSGSIPAQRDKGVLSQCKQPSGMESFFNSPVRLLDFRALSSADGAAYHEVVTAVLAHQMTLEQAKERLESVK